MRAGERDQFGRRLDEARRPMLSPRAIGDAGIERVTVLKSSRVGFTALLCAAIGHHCVNEPAPVLVLQPAEADVRLQRYDPQCSPPLQCTHRSLGRRGLAARHTWLA